jgi:hypothetical protein
MIMRLLQTNETNTKGYYGDEACIDKAIETAGKWIDTHYRQVQDYAATASARYGRYPFVARICKLLAPKPYRRPTHDLICECRKCGATQANGRRYWSYLKQGIEWSEEGHII